MFGVFRELVQTLVIGLTLTFPTSQDMSSTEVVQLNSRGEAIFSAQVSEESYERLMILYKKTPFNKLILNSPGGDFDYGVKLGEFVYKEHLEVYVPVQCNSACSIAFFSARKSMRDMSNIAILGLHNVSLETNTDNPDKTYVSVTEMRDYAYQIADKVGYMFTLYSANRIPPTVLYAISKRRGEEAVVVTRKDLIEWGALNP